MLRWVVPVVAMTALTCGAPVYAESRTPPQATAHALDELANCRAQRRPECPTDTPTLTPAPRSTSMPTAAPLVVEPAPSDTPSDTPTAAPAPCWFTDQATGDPDNGYIVFVPLYYTDGGPALDADGNQQYGPIQIPCDSTPTPTPSITDTLTLTPTHTPRPAVPLAPVRQVAPAAPPTPRVVYVYVPAATAMPGSPTDTPTPRPTAEPTPTRTLVPAGLLFFNPSTGSYERLHTAVHPIATRVAPVVATPTSANAPADTAHQTVSWAMLGGILAATVMVGSGAYGVWVWQRRRYRAQLAQLEAET